MDFSFSSFATYLSIVWFLVYWILGGVFFAVIAILRLGRVRKVRFSCLFSLWALLVAVGVAFKGLAFSEEAIKSCLATSTNKAETIAAIFGCGATGVFGAFLLGALAITVGGFLIFTVSRSKSKPWIQIDLEAEEGGNRAVEEEGQGEQLAESEKSKFF